MISLLTMFAMLMLNYSTLVTVPQSSHHTKEPLIS